MNISKDAVTQQAEEVSHLVVGLGRKFQEIHEQHRRTFLIQAGDVRGRLLWEQHRSDFEALIERLRVLADFIQQPSADLVAVAQGLRSVAVVVRMLHNATASAEALDLENYLDLFPDLNSAAYELGTALGEVRRTLRRNRYDDVLALAEHSRPEDAPAADQSRTATSFPCAAPAEPRAARSSGRKRGGRPANVDLYQMIFVNDTRSVGGQASDAELASAYNQRFSRRKRIDAGRVADTRRYMKQIGWSPEVADCPPENSSENPSDFDAT